MKHKHLVGEKFKYNKSLNIESYCVVNQIETMDKVCIFHVSVIDVLHGGELIDIDHMPFSEDAFERSITEKIGFQDVINQDALDAINIWREMNGGIWSNSISEAVGITLKDITF